MQADKNSSTDRDKKDGKRKRLQEIDGETRQPIKTEMTETELKPGLICLLFSLTLKLNEPNRCFVFYGILDKKCLLHIHFLHTQIMALK